MSEVESSQWTSSLPPTHHMKCEASLAAWLQPYTLDEYVGQEHFLGHGKLLRRAIEADRLFSSIILWGPPGTGKTTLPMVTLPYG